MIGESWGQAARQWAVELSQAIPITPDPMIQLLKDCYRVLVSPGHADDRVIASAILAIERNALLDREYDQEVSALGWASSWRGSISSRSGGPSAVPRRADTSSAPTTASGYPSGPTPSGATGLTEIHLYPSNPSCRRDTLGK
jgi:hypothetical protein